MKNLFYLAVVLASCRAATIPLEESFKGTADAYEVSGKNGWLIKQKISFGPYKTEPIDPSMTLTYQVPFLVDFAGGKESISFQLFDSDRQLAATLHGTSKLKDVGLGVARDYFQVSLKEEDVFSGSVIFAQPEVHHYDFMLLNPNYQLFNRKSQGVVTKGNKDWVEIRGVSKLEGSKIAQSDIYGYEFYRDGEMIGAVDIINKGRVWIQRTLDDETKLVLASLSTALMARKNLQEEVDEF